MPRIKVNQPEIASLRQRLSAVQNTGNNAVSNVGRVRANLDWQVTSQQGIDARLNAIQRRLQTQMELMGQYSNFLNTVNDRFAATDRNLRDKASGVLYQMNQISQPMRLTNPPRGGISGIAMAGVTAVAGLFGSRTMQTPPTRTPLGWLGDQARNRVDKLGDMNSAELFYKTIVGGTSGMVSGLSQWVGNTSHVKGMSNAFLGISAGVGVLRIGSSFLESRRAGHSVGQSLNVAAEKTLQVGGGILGAKTGAAKGAKWGMALGGPKGAIVGGLVGGLVGSGAGEVAGKALAGGARAIGGAIASFNPFRRRR